MAINPDGDSGEIDHDKRIDFGIETSQKTYVTFHFEVTNKGGHSSEPRPDNAIYELTDGLEKLSKFQFPIKTNARPRGFISKNMAALKSGQERADYLAMAKPDFDPAAAQRLSQDVALNAILHSTCVATMLNAGVQGRMRFPRARSPPSSAASCRMKPLTAQKPHSPASSTIPASTITTFGEVLSSPESLPDPETFRESGKHRPFDVAGRGPVIPVMSAGAERQHLSPQRGHSRLWRAAAGSTFTTSARMAATNASG